MRAFVWHDGKMTDLRRATGAAAINDRGWIVGSLTTLRGDRESLAILLRRTTSNEAG